MIWRKYFSLKLRPCNSIIYRCCLSTAPQQKTLESKEDVTQRVNESFMANIFRGNIVPNQVFPFPDVLSAEQKELTTSLVDPFERFFLEVNDAARNDENSTIDNSTLEKLWELGAFGIQVPMEYGGLGLNNTQYGRLCEIIGANDLGLGITLGAHQSIGFKGILLFGSDEQKKKYLPRVVGEGIYAAFALTEPSSGSDAGSIRTRAVKSTDGKHYILNGSKIWISNGGVAEIMTVFAQTAQIDTKTGEKKDKVTAFIVERSFGGVSSGPPERKMGIKASNTASVYFEDVKVPVENVLGKEGEGFKVAMNILNNGRFGMGATLAGTMKYCIIKAINHANSRIQFGKKIKDYGSIQEKIAKMNILQYVTESMAYTISQNMDAGSQEYHLEAAISKIFASEAAWCVCDEAIQVLGGMGYMKECGIERVMRDLRIFRIFEGTNDILRLFVALTGIQFAGSHLKDLQKAFKNPANNLGLIFQEASHRAALKLGLRGADLSAFVAPELQPYAKKTAQCIDKFGITVEELLLKYGKNIVDEQFLLNCLANAAIDIYSMTVTQSRCTRALNNNLPTAAHELNLTKAWTLQAAANCSRNLGNITSEHSLKINKTMITIADQVCRKGDIATTHILK